MLQIQNLTKSFGGIKALQGCTFAIKPSQITAVIGPNGAGKTTLFDVMSGLLSTDSGAVILNQENILRLRSDEIANLGISRTFQQVRLFRNLTILDHLIMAEGNEDTKLVRNLLAVGRKAVSPKTYDSWLKAYGLDKPLETLVSNLSYGQRKLLQLAMAVLKPHRMLLLDEPVAGVNKVVQAEIEKILLELKSQGETVVLIDHDMEFVRRLADKVVVMDAGRVLVEGPPNVVLKDQRVLEAYLGE